MLRRMRFSTFAAVLPLLAALGAAGCVTAFSPATIRDEIVRQTGRDPQGVFELALGRPTLALARAVLSSGSPGGRLPLEGVATFQLAVYEVPGGGADLDFTRMPVRGWDPLVRFREESKSALVLVRAPAESVGDLVLVAGGVERVLYARIRGRLSPDLPEALGRIARSEGPDGVRRELMSLTDEAR